MRRKVLIIPSWYPSKNHPLDGIFVQDQAQVLCRQFDVAVLYPKLVHVKAFLKREILRSTTDFEDKIFILRDYGFAVPRFRKQWYGTLSKIALGEIERLISQWGRPDLIHAHIVLPGGWVAAKLKERYSIPLVLTEHSSPFSMHLGSRYNRRLVQETLKACDKVIAVSWGMKMQMKDWVDEEKIEIIGNVIRTDYFRIETNSFNGPLGPKRILCVSIMKKQKGLSNLLKACKGLLDSGEKDFILYLGGEGEIRSQLEREVVDLGLSDHCLFLGVLNREKVRDWMQRCDFFVLSSLHETFGIVVGEAMACGKPVITTQCGGPEFIMTPDSGILVQPGDIDGLKKAMRMIITRLSQFDSNVIRESVRSRFGEEAFLLKIGKVYNEVMEQSK
jgi:glycosyltransferase involved in cell wall biosynthesis